MDAFCKIYTQDLNFNELKNTHDLYSILWRQKVVIKDYVEKLQMKEFLNKVASEMYDTQQISIPIQKFYDKYSNEIENLSSNGIIINSGREIQFFHQTFYDFVFAKQFCEGNNSLIKYLNENWQGLKVRSSLKMILGFLRDTNHKDYIRQLNQLLFGKRIRFHIKLLLIHLLGFEEKPTDQEKLFVTEKVLKDQKFRNLFIESVIRMNG